MIEIFDLSFYAEEDFFEMTLERGIATANFVQLGLAINQRELYACAASLDLPGIDAEEVQAYMQKVKDEDWALVAVYSRTPFVHLTNIEGQA